MSIDWSTTGAAGVSFLLHFGAVAAFHGDWADRVVREEGDVHGIVETFRRLPAAPAIEEVASPTTHRHHDADAYLTPPRPTLDVGAIVAFGETLGDPTGDAHDTWVAPASRPHAPIDTAIVGTRVNRGSLPVATLLDGAGATFPPLDGPARSSRGTTSLRPVSHFAGCSPHRGDLRLLDVCSERDACEPTQVGWGTAVHRACPWRALMSCGTSASHFARDRATVVMQQHAPMARACWDGSVDGVVALTLALDARGRVERATASSSSLPGAAVECVRRSMRDLPLGSGPAVVTGAYLFSRAALPQPTATSGNTSTSTPGL